MEQSNKQRRWYLRNKAAILERRKEYYKTNKADCDFRNRAWINRNKDQSRKIKSRWWNANKAAQLPKKYARNAVWWAVRDGKIVRPKECSKCGKKCKPEAHHFLGYGIENRLNVVWLCKKCHVS